MAGGLDIIRCRLNCCVLRLFLFSFPDPVWLGQADPEGGDGAGDEQGEIQLHHPTLQPAVHQLQRRYSTAARCSQ